VVATGFYAWLYEAPASKLPVLSEPPADDLALNLAALAWSVRTRQLVGRLAGTGPVPAAPTQALQWLASHTIGDFLDLRNVGPTAVFETLTALEAIEPLDELHIAPLATRGRSDRPDHSRTARLATSHDSTMPATGTVRLDILIEVLGEDLPHGSLAVERSVERPYPGIPRPGDSIVAGDDEADYQATVEEVHFRNNGAVRLWCGERHDPIERLLELGSAFSIDGCEGPAGRRGDR
jgi:hypothetical protein